MTQNVLSKVALKLGHFNLTMPVADHLVHTRIAYAGTHFMLMDVSGAAICMATHSIEKLVPQKYQMAI